ncbi:hypothetical protein [Streptosporangium sp. V21-05]|uniref:hypothetical protein n=1 Tax=Streptosporangium sp. V21-05 TaxID=3446115 RepID=UPI003F52EE43
MAATFTALAVAAGVLLVPPLFGEEKAASAPKAGASLDLAAFPPVDVVDRFAEDTSGQYAAYRENGNEILPVTTAGSGKFAGTGPTPFFGLVAGTGTPSSDQAVSVLTTGTFAGTGQPEDSVFVGWVKGGNDYVTAWYNNARKDTGIDVRVNGVHLDTPGQSSLSPEPGNRFALLLSGDRITSYAETGGVWHRLVTADIGDVLTTPKGRQEYRYGFGLRGSTGTIGIAGTEGRSAG